MACYSILIGMCALIVSMAVVDATNPMTAAEITSIENQLTDPTALSAFKQYVSILNNPGLTAQEMCNEVIAMFEKLSSTVINEIIAARKSVGITAGITTICPNEAVHSSTVHPYVPMTAAQIQAIEAKITDPTALAAFKEYVVITENKAINHTAMCTELFAFFKKQTTTVFDEILAARKAEGITTGLSIVCD